MGPFNVVFFFLPLLSLALLVLVLYLHACGNKLLSSCDTLTNVQKCFATSNQNMATMVDSATSPPTEISASDNFVNDVWKVFRFLSTNGKTKNKGVAICSICRVYWKYHLTTSNMRANLVSARFEMPSGEPVRRSS